VASAATRAVVAAARAAAGSVAAA
jgi:hypothetical protein